ncbi:integral membrane protein [Streptantibioticus cattleyicolor NRRL 8057 = DSM 46488]|uniref:Integral membrane protein n=1 Tax=Streptantibioticus cattleyicolor (strain ATCC 35852 / DSM 46488 / JCM 4925 / NBRC 14057 / NRRL 8057) TaxID=1003195 RepID=G8WWR2_STREN|nr:integral membrane protein [Streptantibioticus cattleyicolor NRRL 8057 = DSM 46488]
MTVVGIVVLLIAALAFANRQGGGSGSAASGSDATGGSGKAPGPAATAPTGQRPVTTKTSGIATGFPGTAEGAQSAAANYAVALGGDGMFDAARRREIVGAVYDPAVANATIARLDKTYTDAGLLKRVGLTPKGTAPAGLTFVSRATPVGTKLDALGNGTAKVEVWCSSLFGLAGDGSTNPVSESWYTTTFDLRWADNDWKVTGFSQKDGPTPVGRDQTASTAKEMTDAVNGFGGLTYAR